MFESCGATTVITMFTMLFIPVRNVAFTVASDRFCRQHVASLIIYLPKFLHLDTNNLSSLFSSKHLTESFQKRGRRLTTELMWAVDKTVLAVGATSLPKCCFFFFGVMRNKFVVSGFKRKVLPSLSLLTWEISTHSFKKWTVGGRQRLWQRDMWHTPHNPKC